jgi:hypothetical protein
MLLVESSSGNPAPRDPTEASIPKSADRLAEFATSQLVSTQLLLLPGRAKFNGHETDITHTYRNDLLIVRNRKTNLPEIPKQHSAEIAGQLEARWEMLVYHKSRGEEPPHRDFAFYDNDANFYDNMSLTYLGIEIGNNAKKKHTAIFTFPSTRSSRKDEFKVMAIDNIHHINLAMPEEPIIVD